MNLTIAILDFGVRLYGGSKLSKHLSKCLVRIRKTEKNVNLIQFFLWQTNILEAVCKCDWHNVRLYLFFNVPKIRTRCPMTLRLNWKTPAKMNTTCDTVTSLTSVVAPLAVGLWGQTGYQTCLWCLSAVCWILPLWLPPDAAGAACSSVAAAVLQPTKMFN